MNRNSLIIINEKSSDTRDNHNNNINNNNNNTRQESNIDTTHPSRTIRETTATTSDKLDCKNNTKKGTNSNANTKMASTTTYSMSAGGPVRRIRTPHPHDVLSGRGGGINSHAGNKTFRDWVRERKEAYNLAGSKAEKARVANEVMQLVKSLNPPGRFLQRDPSAMTAASWWVEIDDTKALAKTSQALREGAPQIRAAHKDELKQNVTIAKQNRRKQHTPASSSSSSNVPPTQAPAPTTTRIATVPRAVASSTIPSQISPLQRPMPMVTPAKRVHDSTTVIPQEPNTQNGVAPGTIESLSRAVQEAKEQAQATDTAFAAPQPLLPNRPFDPTYLRPTKRVRMDEPFPVNATAETPPLLSTPAGSIPSLQPGMIPPPVKFSRSDSRGNNKSLVRAHSLALSDISSGDMYSATNDEFVNPFADESLMLGEATENADSSNSFRGFNMNNNGKETPIALSRERSLSNRSISELSDLPEASYVGNSYKTDFEEGVRGIFDIISPDITSPDKEDWIPTHLMPWHGGSMLGRTTSLASSRCH